MEQEVIKPDKVAPTGSQAFSPLGCFIAASGVTLLTFCLLGSASVVSVWAIAKLIGLGEGLTNIFMLISLVPPVLATLWTAGRAWHVERRLAQHLDIDTPVFKIFHYYKK